MRRWRERLAEPVLGRRERQRLTSYAKALLESGAPAVLAGDFNVMPTDLDVYAPERWVDDGSTYQFMMVLVQHTLFDCHLPVFLNTARRDGNRTASGSARTPGQVGKSQALQLVRALQAEQLHAEREGS